MCCNCQAAQNGSNRRSKRTFNLSLVGSVEFRELETCLGTVSFSIAVLDRREGKSHPLGKRLQSFSRTAVRSMFPELTERLCVLATRKSPRLLRAEPSH